jgi:hypothetical protein
MEFLSSFFNIARTVNDTKFNLSTQTYMHVGDCVCVVFVCQCM